MNEVTFIIGLLTAVLMTLYVTVVFSYIVKYRYVVSFAKVAAIGIFTAMMASMLNSITFYITTKRGMLDTILSFAIGMALMTQPLVATFIAVIHGGIGRKGLTRGIGEGFTFLLIWNEVSMGIFLYYLFNPTIVNFDYYHLLYSLAFVTPLSYGINTFYFLIPMSVEMIVIFFVYKPKRMHKYASISIFLMDMFSPTLLGNNQFIFIGILGETIIMIIFMIITLEYIADHKMLLPRDDAHHIRMVFIDYFLMAAGTFVGSIVLRPFGLAWILLAMAIIFGMYYYFDSIFRESISSALVQKHVVIKKYALKDTRPFMALVLLLSFLSEWLLAASMNFSIFNFKPYFDIYNTYRDYSLYFVNSKYIYAFSKLFYHVYVPANYGVSNFSIFYLVRFGGIYVFKNPFSYFLAGIYLVGEIINSPEFLIITGLEMGALVIFQMKKIKDLGKRVNLGIALAAYAIYTVLGPNFLNPAWYNLLPLWPTTGYEAGIYPYLVIPLIGSYVLYAILASLFGRRAYCSTLCPYTIMYGSSIAQAMIPYNYESRISRKTIGKKFQDYLYPVISVSWVFAIFGSIFSYYYMRTGSLGFSFYGIDPAYLYVIVFWDILFYAFFISIPFTGMSPCRRYGFCSTGTFVGLFSYLGFFKLKVHDKNLCKTCETKACAVSCETGLAEMPGEFIKNGYFKSSKCVGSGDCIRACPYNNIYFYDFRTFIKEKILKSTHASQEDVKAGFK
ncbi:4Fe-4S binding protein [Picrophilus oshimae]|uniref:Ferredoxin n=1 Tax=Picrophilus torridus (strain ATCC 700027 / DSM 9790 / JCM 10055 / NBRC 100828 / KAW 2/3) TaxID=1122961 RepID=Q6KZG8_PICTO|nr:4Fe-4S binding protein [Picrophilus oshimae]AAT43884.1 ferredoxin [Picrophilus oshimae DSM 9789]SMD31046.1 Polyferredoxin [Picrophilus oshimae DSM 9789]